MRELYAAMVQIFGSMDAAFFLTTITSLNAINITKPTIEKGTIALGQS